MDCRLVNDKIHCTCGLYLPCKEAVLMLYCNFSRTKQRICMNIVRGVWELQYPITVPWLSVHWVIFIYRKSIKANDRAYRPPQTTRLQPKCFLCDISKENQTEKKLEFVEKTRFIIFIKNLYIRHHLIIGGWPSHYLFMTRFLCCLLSALWRIWI